MATVRVVRSFSSKSFLSEGDQEINELLRVLKEDGHIVETMLDINSRGVIGLSDRPMSELNSDITTPIEVFILLSDAFYSDNNLGSINYEGLKTEARRSPKSLFLAVYFAFYQHQQPPEAHPISNTYCWFPVTTAQLPISALRQTINSYASQLSVLASDQQRDLVRIERSANNFIDEAVSSLEKRRKSNGILANAWYASEVIAIGVGSYLLIRYYIPASDQVSTYLVIANYARSLGIISVTAVTLKYCSNLGKAFMSESLRNADRIHAINFGKFYLLAFGDKSSPQEIKEAFSQWNIDQASAFSEIKSSDYDPKVIDAIVSIVKSLGEKKS